MSIFDNTSSDSGTRRCGVASHSGATCESGTEQDTELSEYQATYLAWNNHARKLAQWVAKHLLNRDDVWGQYRSLNKRNVPDKHPKTGAIRYNADGTNKTKYVKIYTINSGENYDPDVHVTAELLENHFRGKDHGHLVGIHTTSKEGTCRYLLVELDAHEDPGCLHPDASDDPLKNYDYITHLYRELLQLGFNPILTDSDGRGGYHLLVVFAGPRPCAEVYWFARWLIRDWNNEPWALAKEPEAFPKQEQLDLRPYGNLMRLPGRHHTHDHWSTAYNHQNHGWFDAAGTIRHLLEHTGDSTPFPPEALEWGQHAHEIKVEKKAQHKRYIATRTDHDVSSEIGKIESALDYIDPDVERPIWWSIGAALNEAMGDEGLEIWDRWSRKGTKYREGECEAIWADYEPGGGVTIGTVYHYATENGWNKDRSTQHLDAGHTKKAKDATEAYMTKKRSKHPAQVYLGSSNGDCSDLLAPPGPGLRDEDDDAEGAAANRAAIATAISATAARKIKTHNISNANRLIRLHGTDMRYCHTWKQWLIWDGTRWCKDETGAAMAYAIDTANSIVHEAETCQDKDQARRLYDHAKKSGQKDRVVAMLKLAEPALAITPDKLDTDHWLFNCLNGTLDLRSGTLKPHAKTDLITKLCPHNYNPNTSAPNWDGTLAMFLGQPNENRDLIDYVRKIFGYCLNGDVSEQFLPIFYGEGDNGKSTILNTIRYVMGDDYAQKAQQSLLNRKAHSHGPTPDVARLFGIRMVAAIETEEDVTLDEMLVKELTGGDKIAARLLYQNPWEFDPTHTPIMSTNHKPTIKGTDHAIWRRLKLVPFNYRIPEDQKDRHISDKLKTEAEGILGDLVRAHAEWLADGLKETDSVKRATGEYRTEQDQIQGFLDECCITHNDFDPDTGMKYRDLKCKAGDIYQAFRDWRKDTGNEDIMTQTKFGTKLGKHGFTSTRDRARTATFYNGVDVLPEHKRSVKQPKDYTRHDE